MTKDETLRLAEELADKYSRILEVYPGSPDERIAHHEHRAFIKGFTAAAERMGGEIASLKAEMRIDQNNVNRLQSACNGRDDELDSLKAKLADSEAEIERLKKIIAHELSENDELGCEYTYVGILRDKLARYEAALEWYASREAWTIDQVEGSHGDYGTRAREALANE